MDRRAAAPSRHRRVPGFPRRAPRRRAGLTAGRGRRTGTGWRRALRALLPAALLAIAAWPAAGEPPPAGLAFEGAEAEAFLSTATVIAEEALPLGVTRSRRLTLLADGRTARAIFKTIDEHALRKVFADGRTEIDFRDSWKNEVAAYELDKLLGIGLVPPVVERRIGGVTGSLQLWVEGAVMESERDAPAVDVPEWNRQMFAVRLFHNLTYNTDFNNVSNVLSVASRRIYLVDHSRAFRTHRHLISPGDLTRFSRPLIENLGRLSRETLAARLGRWLNRSQIDGLLARRDRIVARAEALAAELGEEAVYLPAAETSRAGGR